MVSVQWRTAGDSSEPEFRNLIKEKTLQERREITNTLHFAGNKIPDKYHVTTAAETIAAARFVGLGWGWLLAARMFEGVAIPLLQGHLRQLLRQYGFYVYARTTVNVRNAAR